MTECYFTNLENIAICELKKAHESINVAVSWINFKLYKDVFTKLLNDKVKIRIMLNKDNINLSYVDDIQELTKKGADIRLVEFAGIMHHKFCVIDKHICLFGSFNWTQNANTRNIEDLNICDEVNCVYNYLLEFEALWKLSRADIQLLRHIPCCSNCGDPVINILLMKIDEENENETKIEVLQKCGCREIIVFTDFYDVSVYNNFVATIQKYDCDISIAYHENDVENYHKLMAQQDLEVANYLSFVRDNRMGMPIIHAVGVKFVKYDGEYVYEIIWKERGTDRLVQDE